MNGVAFPSGQSGKKCKGIPPGTKWTKIDKQLVDPAALKEGDENFEREKGLCC